MQRQLVKPYLVLGGFIALISIGAMTHPTGAQSGTGIELAAGAQWKDSNQTVFRVDNFNIRRGKGNDGVRDLSRSIDVLQGTDIAGLQETSGTLFYGWQSQAEQIASALGAGFLFAPTTWRWFQRHSGPALISKFPVTSWSLTQLPNSQNKDDHRLLISAQVVIADRPVQLFVTHLENRGSNAEQLEYLFEQFRESTQPTILMADLNNDDTNQVLQAFLSEPGITDAVEQAIGPYWRLDWIITKGFDVLRGGYTPRGISDHAHYWLELAFNDNNGESADTQEAAESPAEEQHGPDQAS